MYSDLNVFSQIFANVAIVNGNVVKTSADSLVSGNDVATEQGIIENEAQTTTVSDCVCNCENVDVVVDCGTEAQTESRTDVNEIATTGSNVDGETENSHGTTLPDEESVITTGVTDSVSESNTVVTEPNTDGPNIGSEGTTAAANKPEESTTTTTTTAPPPLCSTPGLQAHETDCHAFYDCSTVGSSDGSLRLQTKFCAPNQAFNVEFSSCSRDISTCANDVVCLAKGGVADPAGNNSYYLCEPRLIGGGFHVFHVQCSENQIFYPVLGKCFLDFNNLGQQPYPVYPPYNWNQIEDIDIVKAELKVIKQHDKLKLKLEKEKIKAEKKLEKEAQKEAQRIAKEQEKLLKEQIKQESELFVCMAAGNFPSNLSDTVYYSCVVKKTKYKKVLMKCPLGSKFNSESGTCVADINAQNVMVTDDEGDDNDNDD